VWQALKIALALPQGSSFASILLVHSARCAQDIDKSIVDEIAAGLRQLSVMRLHVLVGRCKLQHV
jgi:hypothetical protein